MLRTIAIAGFGPHEATTIGFDPRGVSELEGPSQSGKSTLVDAVCWCLWGTTAEGKALPSELVRDGAEAAEVTLELGSGTKLARRIARAGRKQVRTKNGEVISTPAGWGEALGPLGSNIDLLRLIIAPLVWTTLAEGAGGGRPLRDLLATILPSGGLRGIVAELMPDLQDGDSMSVDDAYARRTEANRQRDEAAGRLAALREEVERQAVAAPAIPETAAAEALLQLDRAWAVWAPLEAWRAKVAELGERPDDGARQVAITSARAHRDQAQNALLALAKPSCPEPRDEAAALAAAERELAALRSAETCPTCGQPLADHAAQVTAAEKRVKEAAAALARAEAQFKRSEAHRLEQADKADVEHKAAERALQDAIEAPNPAAAWDRAKLALGPEPSAAKRPDGPRPTPEQVAEARAVIDAAKVAIGAQRQAQSDLAAARQRLAAAEQAAETAGKEAARLDRLVEVLRRAPSVAAQRQIERLGDLGPVEIRMPETGPAIEVLIDGRPWWTASRGRLVVADLHLRAALRRAVRLPWLVLFVDDVNAWSGEWPEIPGPQIRLRTAPAAALAAKAAA